MVDGISVKKDYRESPRVCGYRNELSQVVMNIINNARAISRLRNIENPEINISLFRDKDDAVLSIADNGGGIDKKAIPMLFNKFYSTTESSGLGLYISRMIIEQHFNGTISAASEGRYAVFTMRFPRAEFGADSSSDDI